MKIDKLAIGVPYQDKTNIGRWKSAKYDKRDRGNTWFIPYQTIRNLMTGRTHHLFQLHCLKCVIKLHGNAKMVVDPFVGIGSSAIASMMLGKSFVGFDIDKLYLNITAKRLQSFSRA